MKKSKREHSGGSGDLDYISSKSMSMLDLEIPLPKLRTFAILYTRRVFVKMIDNLSLKDQPMLFRLPDK